MSEVKKHTIYLYRSRLDGRCKVGVTDNPERRYKQHIEGRSNCKLFDNYINARAREGYRRYEIFDYFPLRTFKCDSRYAEEWERYYTKVYKASADDGGFCLQLGGYNGSFSEESRRKMSEWHKGKILSEEHCRKISEANKGRIVSEETRRKISESEKGKIVSEETRRKMSESLKNPSEETRRKMSESAKGNTSHAGENYWKKKAAEKNTLTFNF